jgi:hypothetical protein
MQRRPPAKGAGADDGDALQRRRDRKRIAAGHQGRRRDACKKCASTNQKMTRVLMPNVRG